MSPRQLHRRWHRRLVGLEGNVRVLFEECRVTGDAETIHDLRVAIRRARLYAHLGRPLLRKSSLRRFNAWSRTINDLLGPVRDCDVCMNWLSVRPGTQDAVQLIREERRRLWNLAFRVLKRRKSDFRSGMVFRKGEAGASQKLWGRDRKELKRLAQGVSREAARTHRMKPEELHDLRRQLRRWRYLRELSLSKRGHRTDPLLAWLVRVQDALGESQNLQMALTLFQTHSDWLDGGRYLECARSEQARWIARARRQLSRMPTEVD